MINLHSHKEIKQSDLHNLSEKINQNKLIDILIGSFTTKELLEICETIVICTLNPKRDLNDEFINVYLYNKKIHTLIINDILQLDRHPCLRYIEVIIKYSDYSMSWLYTYQKDIYYILFNIVAKAYNYSAYCKEVESSFLYKEYARKVIPILLPYLNTFEFKRLKNKLLKFNIRKKAKNLLEVFALDNNVHVEVFAITNSILRLAVYSNEEKYAIYLKRGFTGIAQLKYILELIEKHDIIYP